VCESRRRSARPLGTSGLSVRCRGRCSCWVPAALRHLLVRRRDGMIVARSGLRLHLKPRKTCAVCHKWRTARDMRPTARK
jgi:hypothetical protein